MWSSTPCLPSNITARRYRVSASSFHPACPLTAAISGSTSGLTGCCAATITGLTSPARSPASQYLGDYTTAAGLAVPTTRRAYRATDDGQTVWEELMVDMAFSDIAFTA